MITTLLLVLGSPLASPYPDLNPIELGELVSAGEARIGVDGSGHAYDAYSISYPGSTQFGFKCYREDAPETQVTVMYGTSNAPSSAGSIVIAVEGDGAFVPPSSWFSCRDALAGGAQVPAPITALPAGSRNIIVSPDGARVCGVTTSNANGDKAYIDCVRRGSDVVERWADSTTWDAALGIVPFEDLNPSGEDRPRYPCGLTVCPEVYEGWRLGPMQFSPDGERLYVRADRQTLRPSDLGAYYEHGFYGWLLVAEPGEVSPRVSPNMPLRAHPPDGGLVGGGAMLYEPTLDALLLGPYESEWSGDIIPLGNDDEGSTLSGPRGLGGTAYLAVPLHEAGLGVLSLTNVIVASGAVGYALRADTEGLYLWGPAGRRALELDFDRLDLDGDGLDREVEGDLGTSDWQVSSDGAVSSDSLELLLGSDPLDPSDDPGSRMVPRETLALSSLWELHQPPLGGNLERSFAKHGPMCAAGTCWDAAGDEVGHYAGTGTVVIGVDGSSAGWVEQGTAVFVDIVDGRETRFEGDYTEVVPLDATRGFGIDTRVERMRVDWLGDGAPETLFALSGAAAVDADDELDQVRGRMKVVGYLDGPGALFVSVETTWRTFIWALRPGEAPYPVAKLTGADAVYPDMFVRWADGVSYGYARRLDDLGGRSYGSMLTTEAALIESTTFDSEFFGAANAAWGGVFVQVFGGGTHELVRVPEQAVPGEIYAYGTWGEGSGVLRGVPRGGLIAIEEPGTARTPVTGLGVNALHQLCVAQPDIGIRELGPLASGAAPGGEIARYELRGAKDCVYDDEGGLWILVAPSELMTDVELSVWFRGARGEALVQRDDVLIGDAPLHFEERTGFVGVPTILDRSVACGRMTTRSGHEVVVDCTTQQLSWDGQVLPLNPGGTPVTFEGESMLAERPDGRIVATGSSLRVPIAIDIPTARAVPYVSGNWGVGTALAILPGGAAVDPWTGRSLPAIQPPSPDVGWQAPTPMRPADPLAGEVVEAPGEGCEGASSAGFGLLGVLAMALRWRRGARRP